MAKILQEAANLTVETMQMKYKCANCRALPWEIVREMEDVGMWPLGVGRSAGTGGRSANMAIYPLYIYNIWNSPEGESSGNFILLGIGNLMKPLIHRHVQTALAQLINEHLNK